MGTELAKYNLVLNIGKTSILPLPQPSKEDWVVDLRNALPDRGKVSDYDAISYLDLAVRLASQSPDGSVLKYAVKSLTGSMRGDTYVNVETETKTNYQFRGKSLLLNYAPVLTVLSYVLDLSFHQPALLPLLDGLFDEAVSLQGGFQYSDNLQALMRKYTRLRYSDAICWVLYFSHKYDVPVKDRCACRIVESGDCMPLLFLYLSNNSDHQDKVIEFAKGLDKKDLYGLDNYWLLLYQLFLNQQIKNPYPIADCTFDIMKGDGVNFVMPLKST